MTTSGKLLAAQAGRLRANWPAMLLPLVAADTLGLFAGQAPQWLFIGTAVLAFLAPKESARLTPFAFLAYGAYGLFLFHFLSLGESQPAVYGLVHSGPNDNAGWVLFQAVAFLAAGIWLLAVTGAPGGGAVRRAAAQLRGTDGQPKTVPPLLLLPVLFLWEELFSGPFWFGYGQKSHVVPIVVFAIGVALVLRWPRAAAVAAVAGTVSLGIIGVLVAVHGSLLNDGDPIPTLFGPVALNDGGNLKALGLIQGIALAGVGCALAPRLLRQIAGCQQLFCGFFLRSPPQPP